MRKSKGKLLSEHSWEPFNIKEGITEQRLALFGAVTLAWNDLEGALDTALGLSLELPEPMWVEVTSRINGFDGKCSLLKQCAKIVHQMPEDHLGPIADTLGAAMENKKYRDAVIHAKILDPDSITAPTFERKGNVGEVVVTEEALDCLYERLGWIRAEIDVIVNLFGYLAICNDRMAGEHSEDEKKSALKGLKACIPLLQDRQRRRKDLPPLPKIPEERQAPQGSEAPELRRR